MRIATWMGALAFAAINVPQVAVAEDKVDATAKPGVSAEKKQTKKLSAAEKKQALAKVDANQAEMRQLAEQSRNISVSIGELAVKGNLTTDEKAVDALKELVDELKKINERLKSLEEEVESLKGWVEGQNESLPVMANDILDLKRLKNGTYIQFQYRDADNVDSKGAFAGQHSFNFRRVRLGTTFNVDPKTWFKISFDMAAPNLDGGNGVQLRDAQLVYDIIPADDRVGLQLLAGQQAVPLGYELERSSSEREFPERATYNRKMFNGERNRSAYLKYGLSKNINVFAGMGTSLTYADAEQNTKISGNGGQMAGFGGIRYYGKKFDVGASYFEGKRSSLNGDETKSPTVDRRFFYIDGTYIGLFDPKVFVRGEVMWGNDRMPSATENATAFANPMFGYQLQLGYNVNKRTQVSARYSVFDPSMRKDFDATREYGLLCRYYINPGTSVTLAYEIFEDPSLAINRYNVWTLRYQFKF